MDKRSVEPTENFTLRAAITAMLEAVERDITADLGCSDTRLATLHAAMKEVDMPVLNAEVKFATGEKNGNGFRIEWRLVPITEFDSGIEFLKEPAK